MSKEHVIPGWLCAQTADYLAQVVRDKAGLRWDPNNLTIKDVCQDCNNGPLSRLDEFAKRAWADHFERIVKPGDRPRRVELDERQMTRWLAKVSYNMARAKVKSADADTLAELADFILTDSEPDRRFALYHGTLMPTRVPERLRSNLSNPDMETVEPKGVRIAVVDDPRVVTGDIATARIIGLHSSIFFLLVSSSPRPARPSWRRALQGFERLVPMANRVSVARPILVAPSAFDVASFDRVPMLRDAADYARSIDRGQRGRGGR